MARDVDTDRSGPANGAPAPSERADAVGAWVTAGLVAVVFLLFFREALELPSDIQRWPRWLAITGFGLLGLYVLQQLALTREWRVVKAVDEAAAEARAEDANERTSTADALRAEFEDREHDGSDELETARDSTQYGNPDDYTRKGTLLTLGASALIGLYVLLAYGIGWMAATLLFLPAYMAVNGERSPAKLAGVTIGTAALIYLLFGWVLNTPMTRGEWFEPDWLIDWIPL